MSEVAIRYGYPAKGREDVADVEALAETLCRADDTMHHHEATDDFPCWHCKHKAERLSDWLARHDAALVEQARAEGKAEAEAERDAWKRTADMRSTVQAAVRAEAAETALAGLVAKVEALADELWRSGNADTKRRSYSSGVALRFAGSRLRALIGEAGQ